MTSEVLNHFFTFNGAVENCLSRQPLSSFPLLTPSLCGVLYLFYFLRSALNYLGRTGTFILVIQVSLYFQGQYEFIYRAIQHYISTETARLSSDNVRISGMYFSSYLLTTPYYLSICFICSLIHSFIFCFMTYEKRLMNSVTRES